MDSVTAARRSEIMALVRGRNTKPEMIVRRMVHAMGYRCRLHAKDLPGTPDLVFRSRKKIVFVHGCFRHKHEDCAMARLPKSRQDFWLLKLGENQRRDVKNERALKDADWDVLTIWECELGDIAQIKIRIEEFLDAKC
jgi:DNA mismatch endonuclease (patch repair protein)